MSKRFARALVRVAVILAAVFVGMMLYRGTHQYSPPPIPTVWTPCDSGRASWYGTGHWAKRFPSAVYLGVAVPMGKGIAQCAHNKLPLLTPVRIVNMITGISVVAIVTDRGKFGPGVVVDLNYPLFATLANPILGWCPVRIDTLGH